MNEYKQAVREITDRRRTDLDDGLELWRNALRSDGQLLAAHAAYQDEAIKKAMRQPNELEKKRAELDAQMARAGIAKSDIEPPPRCAVCRDTGYANGNYCKCVIKLAIEKNKNNLVLPQIDFDEKRRTAPNAIAKIYNAAYDYIQAFPNGDKPFFIIAGSSGTGKTVLAAAIASEIMTRGGAAVTITAFDFVKRAKDYHTQFAIEDYVDLFTPTLDCDILVIDDLGTETMLKNITREYLYTVVNERWIRRKYTVITTNLSPNELLNRYGEAIFSRLCDKSAAILWTAEAPNQRIK